jgi:hypothetical protein
MYIFFSLKILTVQAVRSNTKPKTKIPTDDKYKIFGKKKAKPTKEQVVAEREARSRFARVGENQ